ncbi:sigma 32 (RpoH) [Rhodopseudomonas palustris HaA2]|uniref:Sigma 32 (RpoH) n=1 Tax=Rhodopseudomonas palustris (strain HaA2) TaxID=316058 RepID=Q2J3Q2_RHOP2|nr:RNA polymerase factor sigma-32 [Rhodopseudomonas palustris]ABD04908.1 sigma 32 (RpoH) [Rhodopseudomonas palustris HaA2]
MTSAFSSSSLAPAHSDAAVFDEKSYMRAIGRYPVLEPDEEARLWQRWLQHRDKAAADALITSHLRLAAKLARDFRRYGFPLGDLIAEANLGLMMALDRFDPERGARFSTCAVWWIRSAIYDHIIRSWSLVRIGRTPAQKKLFFRLRGEIRRLQPDHHGTLTKELAEQISATLDVPLREVIEMEQRLSGDRSLNTPLSDLDESGEWQDLIADDAPNAEAVLAGHDELDHQRRALQDALVQLDARERYIFSARHLGERPASFETIGQSLSISAERVRQIEARAFAKVANSARRTCGTARPAARVTSNRKTTALTAPPNWIGHNAAAVHASV